MRLIRNPFNEMEVKKILKYMVPICENVKQYAWYQNDLKKTIVEAPKWKNKLNKDALLKRYNRKYPLDTNDSSNIFNIGPDIFNPNKFIKIRRILEHNYNARVILRGSFYYPPTGYMGWHTNCAAPGERFYMTWASEDKKSFFRYYDHEKDEIITDYDDKGLTVRQFKVPESYPYFWHCVGSECDRFSFGYMIDSRVTLDFNTHQKIVDKIGSGNISNYIAQLVENDKKSDYIKSPTSLTGRHSCNQDSMAGGDWRIREANSIIRLPDIRHLLTDDRIQTISFDDVARKGMHLPVKKRRDDCFCCGGERYFACDISYLPIVCKNMPNPYNKKYRCIDGKHRIEKMLSKNMSKLKCYVFDYSDIEKYIIDCD